MADYYAWTVTGVVTGLKSWSEPEFGSGPDTDTAGRKPVDIAPKMVERQTFSIRERDGREIDINLVDSGLRLRNGHVVTAVWVARRGVKHGFCVIIDNHTTGAQIRLFENIKKIRPKVGLARTAKFGVFATIPALLAMMMWLLVPGSLTTITLTTFLVIGGVALTVLFIIGLIVSKLVLDYLQADDHQKIWETAVAASEEMRFAVRQTAPRRPRPQM